MNAHKNKKMRKPPVIQKPKPKPKSSFLKMALLWGGISLGIAGAGYVYYEAHQFDERFAGQELMLFNTETKTLNTTGEKFSIFEKVSFMRDIHAHEDTFESNLDAFAKWIADSSNHAELSKMWEVSREVKGIISFQNGSFKIEIDRPLNSIEPEVIGALDDSSNFFKKTNHLLRTRGEGFVYELDSVKVLYGIKASREDLQAFVDKLGMTGEKIPPGASMLMDLLNSPPRINLGTAGDLAKWIAKNYKLPETLVLDVNSVYLIMLMDKKEAKPMIQDLTKGLSEESAEWILDMSGFPQEHFARFHTHNKELNLLPVGEDCSVDIKNTKSLGPGVVFRMFPDGMCEAVAMSNGEFRVLGKFKVHEP